MTKDEWKKKQQEMIAANIKELQPFFNVFDQHMIEYWKHYHKILGDAQEYLSTGHRRYMFSFLESIKPIKEKHQEEALKHLKQHPEYQIKATD